MPDKKKKVQGRNYLELHSEEFKNYFKRRYWNQKYESANYFYTGLFKFFSIPFSLFVIAEQYNQYMDFDKVMN